MFFVLRNECPDGVEMMVEWRWIQIHMFLLNRLYVVMQSYIRLYCDFADDCHSHIA